MNPIARAPSPRSGHFADACRIELADGLPLDVALKKFSRQVVRADVLGELKKRAHHVKPGEARRIKSRRARKRVRKLARRETERETEE